jgi:hypothetical protein
MRFVLDRSFKLHRGFGIEYEIYRYGPLIAVLVFNGRG